MLIMLIMFLNPLLECPICFEPMTEIFKTPCNHIYCKTCDKLWKERSNLCPFCREVIHCTSNRCGILFNCFPFRTYF